MLQSLLAPAFEIIWENYEAWKLCLDIFEDRYEKAQFHQGSSKSSHIPHSIHCSVQFQDAVLLLVLSEAPLV